MAIVTKEQLAKIGGYILEGLSEDESCIFLEISPRDLHEAKEKNESVRQYLERMAITFKQVHLKEIAKNKSEKNSMWLLEKLRPLEFGSKQITNPTTVNIIRTIINSIQNGEQQSVLSPRSRGDIIVESNEDVNGRLVIESVLK